jgi:hypothetical protein
VLEVEADHDVGTDVFGRTGDRRSAGDEPVHGRMRRNRREQAVQHATLQNA